MKEATPYILATEGLRKEFSGFTAVDGVNLGIRQGHIHALIGPNGAGKTTCFNLLTRFLTATSGTIRFKGIDITKVKPARVARMGMVRSFQISAVFAHMTVLQNVRVALQRRLGTAMHFWASDGSLRALDGRAMELLERVGLEAFAPVLTTELSYGRKRALEIATTLAMDPEVMLLDEPTQGMGNEDVQRVTELIKRASEGRTTLLVEHNMSVVSSIADRITVMRRGTIIAEGAYATVSKDPRVIEAYMGTAEAEFANAH